MAAERCQVCGAPMDGDTCSYCGEKATPSQQQAVQPVPAQAVAQEQAPPQAQTVQAAPAPTPAFAQAPPQPQQAQTSPQVTEVHHVHHNAPRVSTRSRGIALLLCFFLGMFGAHQFYAGKIGKGILYILTVGVLGIGVIIDFIQLLRGRFRDAEGLFIK